MRGYGYGYGGGLFYIQGFVLQSMTAILPRLGPGRVPASSRDNNQSDPGTTPLFCHSAVMCVSTFIA
jgi:hypothetical protein